MEDQAEADNNGDGIVNLADRFGGRPFRTTYRRERWLQVKS